MINNVTIESARIFARNFSGAPDAYNKSGSRYFCLILPEDKVGRMIDDGWNVKTAKQTNPDEPPMYYIQVALAFEYYPPKMVLISSSGQTHLTAETVGLLDSADLENIDIIIRPYTWNVNGNHGVKAYLKTMYATLREDELDLKYARKSPDVPF